MEKPCWTCKNYKATYGGCGECKIDTKVWAQEKLDGKDGGTYGNDEDCPFWK